MKPGFQFCDDLGPNGFSWIVEEPMARTSHALAAGGKVWLVDHVDWPDAIERAHTLGEPAAVLQLLDRNNRDCEALAKRLGVPRLVAPDEVPGSPFEYIALKRMRYWTETALWWPETKTLVVVAEAVGTNALTTGGKGLAGVHLLLRLTPPKVFRHTSRIGFWSDTARVCWSGRHSGAQVRADTQPTRAAPRPAPASIRRLLIGAWPQLRGNTRQPRTPTQFQDAEGKEGHSRRRAEKTKRHEDCAGDVGSGLCYRLSQRSDDEERAQNADRDRPDDSPAVEPESEQGRDGEKHEG